MLPIRISYVEIVEHDMIDFDVILGMDSLHACFAFIVKFNFTNEPVLQ